MSSQAHSGSSSRSSGGIDLSTLLITAVASAAAAYACSKIWAPGTLASAAFTPVLVAIIKEALARPTQAVAKAVPVRGVVRSTPSASQPGEPPAPPSIERVPQAGEVTYHSTGASARRWRVAFVTGLLGFAVAVLALTVPELLAGQSASGGGRTTLFGGQEQRREKPAETTTAPTQTVTAPAQTVTVPPTTVPTTTAPPASTTAPVEPTATAPAATSTTPTVTEPPPLEP